MGFFFRKSIGFGPLRLNFSKSGIGLSTGVKGARIWTGPRGTYVQVGREGFYYRQKLGNLGPRETRQTFANPEQPSPSDWHNNSVELPHGKVIEAIKPSPANRVPLFIHIGFVLSTIASTVWIASDALNDANASVEALNRSSLLLFTIPPAIWGLGVLVHYLAKRKVGRPLPYPLYYRLDDQRSSRFSAITKALEALKQSHQIWSVKQGQTVAQVAIQATPLIVTNVETWAVSILNWKMFFMPDSIYIFSNGAYSTVPYEDLRMTYREQRVYAVQGHPSDATVVDRTWLHTRKDGYPDRRYKYNPSIPIVLYGLITIEVKAGWSVILQTSNRDSARQFISLFTMAFPSASKESRRSQQQSYSRQTNYEYRRRASTIPLPTTQKSAYEVLGVREGASMEEVTAAYRKQAQMNHPDRVANMAAEFRELAEHRMKDINAAYNELRKASR
jgi:hypothetical protein